MRAPVALLLLTVLGCGARREYSASEVSVHRSGWDTLRVAVGFEKKAGFGEPVVVRPDSFEVRLFSSSFDTLFTGNDTVAVVPDARLGDRELLLVEACGFFGSATACGQRGIEASPKRIAVEHEMEYPENGDYDLGRYRFSYGASRLRHGSDSLWEPVPLPASFRTWLSIRVLGERAEPISVPLPAQRGRFKLTNLRNNADFRRDLLAQLLDSDEATVRFELYTDAFGIEGPIWVSDATVEAKTEQTRELEAGYFVEEAGSRLLDLLRTFPVGPNVYLYMDGWSFDRESRRYEIAFSLSWQSSFLRSRWFEMSATLFVNEDGGEPVVTLTSGNERGTRRWEQRFDGPSVTLDPIIPRTEERIRRTDDDNSL